MILSAPIFALSFIVFVFAGRQGQDQREGSLSPIKPGTEGSLEFGHRLPSSQRQSPGHQSLHAASAPGRSSIHNELHHSGDIRYMMEQPTTPQEDPGVTDFARGMTADEIAKHVMDSDSDDLMHDPEARRAWMDQVIRGEESGQEYGLHMPRERVVQQARSSAVGVIQRQPSPADGVVPPPRSPAEPVVAVAEQSSTVDPHIVRLERLPKVKKCREKIRGHCSVS